MAELPATDPGSERVTFDDVLVVLGEFGLFQKVFYFLFALPYVFAAMQLHGWVFVGANLPHRCLLPGEHEDADFHNVSSLYEIPDSCSYTEVSSNLTFPCDADKFVYDTSMIGDSMVKQWNLVCDKVNRKNT